MAVAAVDEVAASEDAGEVGLRRFVRNLHVPDPGGPSRGSGGPSLFELRYVPDASMTARARTSTTLPSSSVMRSTNGVCARPVERVRSMPSRETACTVTPVRILGAIPGIAASGARYSSISARPVGSATFYPLSGKTGNPSRKDPSQKRRSINIDGGYYIRAGSHNGENASPDKRWWGAELETVTMTANAPGVPADFPLLTIGVGCHVPGAIAGEGKRIADLLAADGYPAGYWFADRAYLPQSDEKEYQLPLIMHGHEFVNDFKKNQLGVQDAFEWARLIQVDGQMYVDLMPDDLRNASITFLSAKRAARKERNKATRKALMAAAKAQFNEHLVMREKYRAKHKGKRRPDGSQQYMYPDPDGYLAFDAHTGEIIEPIRKKTVILSVEMGLKHGQRFPYKTRKWRKWHGLRNTVEASYSFMKDPGKEDLGTAAKRLARGMTFGYLAATLAVVASNVRRVVEFLRSMSRSDTVTAKNRHNAPDPTLPPRANDPGSPVDLEPPD